MGMIKAKKDFSKFFKTNKQLLKNLKNEYINFGNIEFFIGRAIKKECYIEVICLIYNVLGLYLKYRFRDYITKNKISHNFPKDEKWKILTTSRHTNKVVNLAEIAHTLPKKLIQVLFLK